MLIELAIGDAYGAGFEYVDKKIIDAHNDLSDYIKHPWHEILPGQYTDDTQMSIAIIEAILEKIEWTPENLANKFVEVFKRDSREGYSKGFFSLLQKVSSGRELLEAIIPNSDKSGAAMRATPIGIYANLNKVLKYAEIQAKITHDTPDGIHAAQASALMAHYFFYKLGPKYYLGSFLEKHIKGEWNRPYEEFIGAKGWMSVRAAITAIQKYDRLSEILKFCVDLRGDVDTAGCIACAVASLCSEIENDLPKVLYKNMEQGSYGYPYLG